MRACGRTQKAKEPNANAVPTSRADMAGRGETTHGRALGTDLKRRDELWGLRGGERFNDNPEMRIFFL